MPILQAFLVVQTTLVPFMTVAQGGASLVNEPRQVVVRTTAEWQSLWKGHNPKAPVPQVDFAQLTVVGVFLGTRPTAGFTVEIAAVNKGPDGVQVEYRERGPAPGTLVAQVLTSPFHLVTVPRETGPVEFRQLGP